MKDQFKDGDDIVVIIRGRYKTIDKFGWVQPDPGMGIGMRITSSHGTSRPCVLLIQKAEDYYSDYEAYGRLYDAAMDPERVEKDD